MGHHVVPAKTYRNVLFVLLFLTIVTVLAAQVDLGQSMNTLVAIGIATVKAAFVGAIFMNLKYDDKLNMMVFFFAVFFLILLYSFSMMDYISRIDILPVINM